jgi:hypothetical protein
LGIACNERLDDAETKPTAAADDQNLLVWNVHVDLLVV